MQRTLSVLIGLVVLLTASAAFAEYPKYLGGDRNYILCDGHMGVGFYVDRSSLNVQKYDPPQYIISIKVISVENADRGSTEMGRVQTKRFFYNYDLRQMYVARDGNEDWRYLNPKGSWAETGVVMPAGEMAFALAYHLKFYGKTASFEDSFYDRI